MNARGGSAPPARPGWQEDPKTGSLVVVVLLQGEQIDPNKIKSSFEKEPETGPTIPKSQQKRATLEAGSTNFHIRQHDGLQDHTSEAS